MYEGYGIRFCDILRRVEVSNILCKYLKTCGD